MTSGDRRRRWLAAVVFPALGAAANLVVAWSIVTLTPARSVSADARRWETPADRAWIETLGVPADDRYTVTAVGTTDEVPGARFRIYQVSRVVRPEFAEDVDDPSPYRFAAVRVEAGWPLPSFRGGWREGSPGGSIYHRAFKVPALSAAGTGYERALPFGPMLPGLAVNSIVGAAVTWLIWMTIVRLNRLQRGLRGRCPLCGYPGGRSAICTECGRELPRGRARLSR